MAAVVVYAMRDSKPHIFIGKESQFLSDRIGRESTRSMEHHAFEKPVTFDAMKHHFTEVAKTMSQKLGVRVQYDTPRQDPVTFVGKTHLRVLPTGGVKYGIVKGGMEEVDKGDTLNTALREFKEECMNVPVQKSAFQKAKTHASHTETPLKGRDLYFLNITPILKLIDTATVGRQADHYGELFDSNMMTFEDVCKVRNKLNYSSRYAIDVFVRDMKLPPCVTKGGLLRRRKTHRRSFTGKSSHK